MSERISCVLGSGLQPRSVSEIAAMPNVPGPRVSPIRHESIIEAIRNCVNAGCDDVLKDEFHAITENGARYYGLFDIKTRSSKDFRWIIGATNANDGSASFSMHSGIVLPEVALSISFDASMVVTKYRGFLDKSELESLVNESLLKLREHYNLCFQRMDHLKSCKLTNSTASELIVSLLGVEVIAGRLAHELIMAWKRPKMEYIKPRNMWSLYCLCAWFLNRLRDTVLIERTQNLNHFFDDMAKFDKKPTRWVQETFA